MNDLLLNWGRWVRVRQRQGHCQSIEHRFSLKRVDDTPYGWGDWLSTPPPVPLPAIDLLRALEVERVMRHLPRKHRKALKQHYVLRTPWKMACKRLHIAYDLWGRVLSEAQNMVENLLTRHEKRNQISRQFDSPAPADDLAPVGAGCV